MQKGYPKEQISLVIMDTFKGQDNDKMRKLCAEDSCEIVIIPHRHKCQQCQPILLFQTNTILGLPMKCRSS